MRTRTMLAITLLAAGALLVAGLARAQHAGHGQAPAAPPPAPAAATTTPAPVRVTMEELHRAGGVPPGWRFAIPPGNAKTGREVFVKLECYQCHEVKGESFPAVPKDPKRTGSALSGMGDQHPAEYFAESIVNPNAVIVTAPGYTGDDGLSIMPNFGESLSVSELIDLVAYLKSLSTGAEHGAAHGAGHDGGHAVPEREQTVGDYRVRLTYHAHDAGDGAHGTPGGAHGHGAGAAHGHLVVLVSDPKTGEPVPYLPVSATIHAEGRAPRTLRLVPMVGAKGFHYGATVTLPEKTTRVVVTLGPTTMQVMPSAAGRFAKKESAGFDWRK